MADNCLRKEVNGGKIILKGRSKSPNSMEAFDEDIPSEIAVLVGRCEIGETSFPNDDMSQALKFGEMLWKRLCSMAEHYQNMADQYGTGSLRSDMLLQGAKDMRHVLADTRNDCGLKLRGADIPKTGEHDAGAIARCSYCGRYSDNPLALRYDPRNESPKDVKCVCGKTHGWCGSFEMPTADSLWSD